MKITVFCGNKRQSCKSWIRFLCLYTLLCGLVGCGEKGSTESFSEQQFPSFQGIIETNESVASPKIREEDTVRTKVYFDNTGSMAGFTVNGAGKKEPDSAYVNLMRCLRDMGSSQDVEYYVLGEDVQDWVLYEDGIFDNFSKPEFHVGWNSGQPGPLAKLYMNNRIDGTCVNIVLTDLAEQRLNNTQLAGQIQKMCDEESCEADLYAFKFEFNGPTQVPNPGAIEGMLEKEVHGDKPYYMIITGPSQYMGQYRKELKERLGNLGMKEETDYFTVTNHMDIIYDFVTMSDVVFEPFADYDEIKEEAKEQKSGGKKSEAREESEVDENGENIASREKSKNLQRYKDVREIFEGNLETETAAFYYQKVEGAGRNDEWRLNFYIPLNNYEDLQWEYTYQCDIYRLEQMETEEEQGQQEESGIRKWMEDTDSRAEVSMEVRENFEGEYPTVLYISCKDKQSEGEKKKTQEPRDADMLLIIRITRDRTYSIEKPDWLVDFDTGDTDDYFTRTFNLNGFYDILFGNKNRLAEDGKVHIYNDYAQIPVLVTDLKE